MEASINLPDDGDHDGVIQLLLKPQPPYPIWQEVVIPERVENLYAVIVAGGEGADYKGRVGGTKRAIFLRPKELQLARVFVMVGLGYAEGGDISWCPTFISVERKKNYDAINTNIDLQTVYLYAGARTPLPNCAGVDYPTRYVDGYGAGGGSATFVGGGGGTGWVDGGDHSDVGGNSVYSAGGGGLQGSASHPEGYAGGASGAQQPATLSGQNGLDGDILNTCGGGGAGGYYGVGVNGGDGGNGGFPGGGAGGYGFSSLGGSSSYSGKTGVGGHGCALIYMW